MENFDLNAIGAAATAAAASIFAAYSDFSTAPSWKKAVMIAGPVLAIGFFFAVVS